MKIALHCDLPYALHHVLRNVLPHDLRHDFPLTADSISQCKIILRLSKSRSSLKPPGPGYPFCGWDLFP